MATIFINKDHKIYTISINNNNGPKEFILDRLSKQIKSDNISLNDERLYNFLKNELNERQLNTNTVRLLLNDIEYERNNNLNVANKTEKIIDIYSVSNNLLSTENILTLLKTDKNKFQEYDFELEIIDNASINLILKANSEEIFEIYDLLFFINKKLSAYVDSIQGINLFQSSNKEWIKLDKGNIKYNFSYLVKYILIFIFVIITNIVLNILDQKIYTVNRSRFLLNKEFDFILNNKNSNYFQNKLLHITKNYIASNKILFLINNSNKHILEEIKKHQKKNDLKKIDFLKLENLWKVKEEDVPITIIFVTGYGLHNTKEIFELRTFINNNRNIYKLKTIYLSSRLGFL